MLLLDQNGMVKSSRITKKRYTNIERGKLEKVNGIVVHQTYSKTAESAFNSYQSKGATGAHFLIEIVRKNSTEARTAK